MLKTVIDDVPLLQSCLLQDITASLDFVRQHYIWMDGSQVAQLWKIILLLP
jgi:hypothetical protein